MHTTLNELRIASNGQVVANPEIGVVYELDERRSPNRISSPRDLETR